MIFIPQEPIIFLRLGTEDLMVRLEKSPCHYGISGLGGGQRGEAGTSK